MKYLETNSVNPFYNLAFEEYLLKNYTEEDYLLLWQNENTVVVGAHQNPFEEINFTEADKHNIHIVRRITGGGAVYHDLGNLNFSYITDWNNGEKSHYEHFLQPIINAFEEIDIRIEMKGRNDLLIAGKKISGSAQALVKDRILHHGTLLIDSNLDLIDKILNVSADKIQSKGMKSVRSRVTNIQDHSYNQLSVADVKETLLKYWSKDNKIEHAQLCETDLRAIEQLQITKYQTWGWNFGRSPDFQYQNKKRFPGGAVEVNLNIEDGRISECMINGDFLSLKPVDFVEDALIGMKYDFKTIKGLIETMPLELYFGSITSDELLSCFANE